MFVRPMGRNLKATEPTRTWTCIAVRLDNFLRPVNLCKNCKAWTKIIYTHVEDFYTHICNIVILSGQWPATRKGHRQRGCSHMHVWVCCI